MIPMNIYYMEDPIEAKEDVFEFYTQKERETFFGKAPSTVYENLDAFSKYPEKLSVLKQGDVFTEKLISTPLRLEH